MNNLLEAVDQWSFKKIFSAMLLTTMALLIPFLWWANQQRNTIGSRAALEPTLMPTPIIYGELPKASPQVVKITPYFGKVGDEIAVEGFNFGNNPPNSELYIGNVKVTEISAWENELLIFKLPIGAVSGNLRLVIGPYQAEVPRPVTIYNADTKTQVSLRGNFVSITNPQKVSRVVVWPKEVSEAVIVPLENNQADSWLSPERWESIEWLTLYDSNNQPVPFWIDPLEMVQ